MFARNAVWSGGVRATPRKSPYQLEITAYAVGELFFLCHLRVVEFNHMVMGPTCGLIRADLGAEVVSA